MDVLLIIILVAIVLAALLRTPLFLVLALVAIVMKFFNIIEEHRSLMGMIDLISGPDDKLTADNLLVPIPLFTLVGYMLSYSKTSTRIINLINATLGKLPGSLGIVTIMTCAFFTPFTGASGITIIALGGLLYPILRKENYSEKYSLGVLTSSGSIGLLFFPSLPILLYAIIGHLSIKDLTTVTNPAFKSISIADMYIAGILPGILLILIPSIYTYIIRRKIPQDLGKISEARKEVKLEWSKILLEFGFIPILLVLFFYNAIDIVETSVITLAYYFILEYVVFKEIKKSEVSEIVRQAMILTGGIIVIVIAASAFSTVLIENQVENKIYELFTMLPRTTAGKIMFLLLLNVILLIVGSIMDIFSAILVVVPLLLPIAVRSPFNIHPIHFGIIFLTNLEIGYSTPPVGLNLFISSFRFNKPLMTLYKATLPFLAMMLVSLMVITYVPEISLAFVADKVETKDKAKAKSNKLMEGKKTSKKTSIEKDNKAGKQDNSQDGSLDDLDSLDNSNGTKADTKKNSSTYGLDNKKQEKANIEKIEKTQASPSKKKSTVTDDLGDM